MPRTVNLIADKLAEREETRAQVLRALTYVVLFAILGTALFHAAGAADSRVSARLAEVRETTKKLNLQRSLLEKQKSRKSEDIALTKWAVGIRTENRKARRALREVVDRMPSGMVLDSMALKTSENARILEISGFALYLEDIATFMGNFSGSKEFGKVMLESTEAAEMNGLPVVKFRCSLLLGAVKA